MNGYKGVLLILCLVLLVLSSTFLFTYVSYRCDLLFRQQKLGDELQRDAERINREQAREQARFGPVSQRHQLPADLGKPRPR